ncbi:DNA polymerase ligase N-terminal domain-containing protein [Bythopirellula polymerisocia]|uniref:ATP-dependent DNA ligase n=1 Tax=Bythopirellula polymerisocia TaxID=2528003 RepID=A0A5C6CQU7_9BACT|nr:DNA polymerase ligase N-terminal domain-containing protein [Bythopirellula polymerisocia]TWU25841.1 ATP-dependent DNA ligase [Bythopirellula polymerisocia]
MPRFVLLRHECPSEYKPSHWDLMLELDGMLATWELLELPAAWAEALNLVHRETGSQITATRLPEHRLAYLTYEGPLSGGRGTVACCDRGKLDIRELRSERILVELEGKFLRCSVELDSSDTAGQWQMRLSDSQK